MSGGRPSDYTEELAATICDRIAGDESLESICRDEAMPASSTVRRWLRVHPEFEANYARARVEQGHSVADTLSDIRKKVLTGEYDPAAARTAADIAKWEASRRCSKHYGDKTLIGSDPENPLPSPGLDLTKATVEDLKVLRKLAKNAMIENNASK